MAMRFLLAWASLAIGFVAPAAAVEEPPFQLVAHWGACELRAYPALVVAETSLAGSRSASESAGFRTLAGYIFGSNAKAEKIEMTAPVVEMRSGDGWTMRFTMPQSHALADLPAPKDARVQTKLAPPARLGVIAFSGFASDGDLAAKGRELADCLKAHGLEPVGPAALAQYDPPWVLGPWRRNEVMIPVK
jgi:hypothetical protein